MNGDNKKIYDRMGEIEIKTAEMHKDIHYIKEKIDVQNNWSKEKVIEVTKVLDSMNERINWNENKIYLFMGGAIVLSVIISLLAPMVAAAFGG